MSQELQSQIALTFVPQVGAVTAKNLVSYCGGAEAVFRATQKELLKIPGVGALIAQNIRSAEPLVQAERELDYLEKHGIEAIFYTDDAYPKRLKQNADSPVLLYFKGSSSELLDPERMVAIVGTRKPTEHGRGVCEEITEGLKAFGATVISGLAYGIDVTAHKKACALGMPNIAVLGHGLGRIYPDAHRPVAEKIIENGGLISEYPHPVGPDREHFPMRNRIVAGMADCLVVVETAASGGSMITASLADQYNREVFAVPGRVRDGKSAGCNLLIKKNKAVLIECAEDLAEEMGWERSGSPRATQLQLFLDLTPDETLVVETIRARPEIAIDQLTEATQLNSGVLASHILSLEFRGVLRTLPGKRYVLAG